MVFFNMTELKNRLHPSSRIRRVKCKDDYLDLELEEEKAAIDKLKALLQSSRSP